MSLVDFDLMVNEDQISMLILLDLSATFNTIVHELIHVHTASGVDVTAFG